MVGLDEYNWWSLVEGVGACLRAVCNFLIRSFDSLVSG